MPRKKASLGRHSASVLAKVASLNPIPQTPETADGTHALSATCEGDEIYVEMNRAMSKQHHIAFLAAVSPDCVQIARLYPEGPAGARFKRTGVRDKRTIKAIKGLVVRKAVNIH